MSNDLLKYMGYRFGWRLRHLWWTVKYFLNGETRRDKRERAAWAKLVKKARLSQSADDMRDAEGGDRPYKGHMNTEHFDLIMRNRVVFNIVDGRTIYEVNTKGLLPWEVDEFWHMLKDKICLHRPRPIIREVISGRFPQ